MGARNFGLHLKDFDPAKKKEVIVGQGALDVPGICYGAQGNQLPRGT